MSELALRSMCPQSMRNDEQNAGDYDREIDVHVPLSTQMQPRYHKSIPASHGAVGKRIL